MLILAQSPAPTPEWRDQLALWSDILGVLGFVISVIGLVFGVLINKQVNEAREEAKRNIDKAQLDARRNIDLANSQRLQMEFGLLMRSLILAREACRSVEWVRMQGHLDATSEMTLRLVNSPELGETMSNEMNSALENIEQLKRIVSNRRTSSMLSLDRVDLLERTIRTVSAATAQFAAFNRSKG